MIGGGGPRPVLDPVESANCSAPTGCILWSQLIGLRLVLTHGAPCSEAVLVLTGAELDDLEVAVATIRAWIVAVHRYERERLAR